MFAHFVVRLFFILPTILVVTIIAFFLKSNMSIDPVEHHAGIYGNERTDYTLSNKEYLDIAGKLNLDKPQFYFSIKPSHYPDTLHQILPFSKQKKAKKLLTKFKDWRSIEQVLNRKEASLPSDTLITNLLTDKVINIKKDTSLLKMVRQIEESESSFVFPSFSFHGSDNQYHHWITDAFSNQAMKSSVSGKKVRIVLFNAFRWTLILTFFAMIITYPLGIWLGVKIHQSKSKIWVWVMNAFDAIYSFPLFILATLLIVFFTTDDYGKWTNLFPAIHAMNIENKGLFSFLQENIVFFILPVICLVLHYTGVVIYYMSSSLGAELEKPYIKTSIAKGQSYKSAINKHAFKNAIFPIVTIVTGSIPASLAGSLIIEVIFNIPGMGWLIYNSVQLADWNVLFPGIILLSAFTILFYWLADILYARIDKRVTIR